ncbi:MAG: hypothetical protein K2P78_02455 [Gemmataceae bacterium]|nr:hypothetical protein [Gemmataceae bacterium]
MTDPAGNANPAATPSAGVTFDEVPPFLTNGAGVPVTITFSEPVTGFDAADLLIGGGAAVSSFQPAGDGKNLAAGNYRFDFAFDALGGATNGVFVG